MRTLETRHLTGTDTETLMEWVSKQEHELVRDFQLQGILDLYQISEGGDLRQWVVSSTEALITYQDIQRSDVGVIRREYNHGFNFAFAVISKTKDASDVTDEMLFEGIRKELKECCENKEIQEACQPPYDTFEL